jgi:enoyl-CoA hydratase
MSLTGDFVGAATALGWGLVTEVVAHDELISSAVRIARTIAEVDPAALRALRRLYGEVSELTPAAGARHERRANQAWMAESFDDGGLEGRAGSIIERGSGQLGPGGAPGPERA